MSILLTGYPYRANPAIKAATAVAWIKSFSPDYGLSTYSVQVWVHRDQAEADANPLLDPIDRITVQSGSELADGTTMGTLAELDATAAAFQKADPTLTPKSAQKQALYDWLMKLPAFKDYSPTKG